MNLVFENEYFLVVDKRPGFLSVPSRMGAEDLRGCELAEWSRLKGRLWPVHRLDLEVGGLLMFAKCAEAHLAANSWFENRQIQKSYEAYTEGEKGLLRSSPGEWVEWKSRLLRGKKRAYERPFGKPSVTRAKFVEERTFRGSPALYWELQPLTGRSHQLRFELSKQGFPIWGDGLYGAVSHSENFIALRAFLLDLTRCEKPEKWGLPGSLRVSFLAATGMAVP